MKYKLISSIKYFIDKIELSKVPITHFFLTFLSIIALRIFLEFFSSKVPTTSLGDLCHLYLFYISFALTLIILFKLITKKNILKIAKIISVGYFFILIAPIFDLIISLGNGYRMGYLTYEIPNNLLKIFLTFFGETGKIGVTIGMRIEIAIIIFGCLIYLYIKTGNKIKSLFGAIACYCLFFAYGITPLIIKYFLSIFDIPFKFTSVLITQFFLLISFFQIILLSFLFNKQKFFEIVKDLRFLRILYYLILFVLGIIIAWSKIGEFYLTEHILLSIILIPISFLFACLFSIITNNLADINIDKISNENRPHINPKSIITKEEYTGLAWISLALALIYGAAAGPDTLFMIILFISSYILYSMPPLRLKRVPFFSKLFIGINSFAMMLLGYILLTNTFLFFPPMIAALALIGFTAVANFIDIKDYEGDKQEGIKTLPVILGLKKAKWIIGTMFFLINLAPYFLVKNITVLLFSICFGLIEFYFVTRNKYNERPVFLALLANVLFIMVYLYVR